MLSKLNKSWILGVNLQQSREVSKLVGCRASPTTLYLTSEYTFLHFLFDGVFPSKESSHSHCLTQTIGVLAVAIAFWLVTILTVGYEDLDTVVGPWAFDRRASPSPSLLVHRPRPKVSEDSIC